MQNTNNDVIRRLGVDPAHLLSPSVYEWPSPEEGEAQGIAAPIVLAAALLGSVATNPVRIPEFERIGVRTDAVDRAPWILKFSPGQQAGYVSVRLVSRASDVVQEDREDQASVWVDLKKAGTVVIVGPNGEAVSVADEVGLRVSSIGVGDLGPVAAIDAPVDAWLEQSRVEDVWFRGEIERKLMAGGPWANITAAAVFARYLEPTPTLLHEWTQAAVSGNVIDVLAVPRRWASNLTPVQVRTIQELARAEVDRLELTVDEVADRVTPEPGSWQSDWVEACHGRDDLEGVIVLLREASADFACPGRLAQLDRIGRVTRSVLPAGHVPSDERTRRAGTLSPGAWWTTK